MLWSFGVLGAKKEKPAQVSQGGFNMNLPGARPPKDNGWNKLRFYEEANKDSARYRSHLRSDPYLQLPASEKTATGDTGMAMTLPDGSNYSSQYDPYASATAQHRDANEEKVYKKLAELNRELSKASREDTANTDIPNLAANANEAATTSDMVRLETLMQQMSNAGEADQQLNQLNGMLEKILDIQHPDRVKERIQEKSEANKSQVFPVALKQEKVDISLLQARKYNSGSLPPDSFHIANPIKPGFYSLAEGNAVEESQTAIRAVIPVTQTIVSGATIKLQLLDDVYIQGMPIPKNQYVFGAASLNGERLSIDINSIRFRNNILLVALSVFDLDGMEGIYMPGAITRDVAKQSTDQAIQSLSIASLDPSLGAQAASAGIQAAKSLIGKKAKMVKVTVRTGYEVLLRDNNKRQ